MLRDLWTNPLQRYVMQERGDDVIAPAANPRTNALLRPALLPDNRQDTGQEGATPADPNAPMVQNLSSRVANAGGGRGFVNPADASTHGSTWQHMARIAAKQGEEKILVCRRTKTGVENDIYNETGHLLSEAAREGFMEGGLPLASLQAG